VLRSRIITAAILACLLLVALFLVPAPWTVFGFGAVFTVAAWEWARFGALHSAAARIAYALGIALLLTLSWVWTGKPAHLILLLGAACAWWVIALLWLTTAPGKQQPLLTLFCGVPVLVPAFVALARLQVSTPKLAAHGAAPSPQIVLWLLLMVFGADIGAFFAGRSFGRRKLAPRVSPSKTWEGAAGGLAMVALIAWGGAAYFGLPLASGIAFGCAVGIISIVGDLTESMFKRAAGLKDSGVLLPGHGGILDRIDSVTAAAPLYALGLFSSGVIA
jgi:phosphatidate cytidylyltransferase